MTMTNASQQKSKPAYSRHVNKSTTSTSSSTCTSQRSNVHVYVRIRPLIAEEEGHEVMDYQVNDKKTAIKLRVNNNNKNDPESSSNNKNGPESSSNNSSDNENTNAETLPTINPAFSKAPPLKSRVQEQYKAFGNLTQILHGEEYRSNTQVYEKAIAPIVEQLLSHNHQRSACVFTYGHTGSGKSHTLLGYDDKNEVGIYQLAVQDLFQKLQQQQTSAETDNEICLWVRVMELYKDSVVDLIDKQNCTIRQEDRKTGIMTIRGPFVEEADGKLEQSPVGRLCQSAEQVSQVIQAAIQARKVGTSTHHNQSSRSHLVLELELVSPALIQKRQDHQRNEAQLTRLQWLQTEKTFRKHVDQPLPLWTQPYTKQPSLLRQEIKDYTAQCQQSAEELAAMAKSHPLLGSTLVFCDLAGNEYAQDSEHSTKAELEEAAEINKSLLAVKEMIRKLSLQHHNNSTNAPSPRPALHQPITTTTKSTRTTTSSKTTHVPYRDSNLTKLLRRHWDGTAVMLAHISPSQESLKKTINTLRYTSMVKATTNRTTTSSRSGGRSTNAKTKKPGIVHKAKQRVQA